MARGSDFDLFFIEHIFRHHKNPVNEISISKASYQKMRVQHQIFRCRTRIIIQLLANIDQKVLNQAFFFD